MYPWIENVTLAPATTPITVLPPDPATTVVWRMTPAGDSDVLVAGPRTKASYHATKDLPVCVRLRIRPGMLPGADASELVDRTVPLPELYGPSELSERLVDYRNRPEQAVGILADYLFAQLPRRRPDRLELVGRAAADLTTRRVHETAARLGVSERYLRRVFRQTVGVSPKHFTRIARVRSVIGPERRNWADSPAGSAAAYRGVGRVRRSVAPDRGFPVADAGHAEGLRGRKRAAQHLLGQRVPLFQRRHQQRRGG